MADSTGLQGTRQLIIVLGDQLNADSAAFDGLDAEQDAVWMMESEDDLTRVWSHKARIAVFLSAMRHFRDELQARGLRVHYRALDTARSSVLAEELEDSLAELKPRGVIMVRAAEWRVQKALEAAATKSGSPLEVREDRHFLCSRDRFAEHARGRKALRQEFFYREMRREHEILMADGKPEGGKWNYDDRNRGSFGKEGPSDTLPAPPSFAPDKTTREVIELVRRRFEKHPGSLAQFAWPVTPADARRALDRFVAQRLPDFGRYQDAMWTGQPFLHHSLLSSSLNLRLLDPRAVIGAVAHAYGSGSAPLPAAEGFIRQVLGWREYVRGIYWHLMPEYASGNALGADLPLPRFYWSADTEMVCARQVISQTLALGYAHHIQRLMVTGLLALLLGVRPREVHEWYLAVYVDALEWVELPNTIGMSQFADGGVMASKPYVASGKYIERMSNYCAECRYDPSVAEGDGARPFTALYWDSLARHRERLAANPRMRLQLANLDRKPANELAGIRRQADALRQRFC